MQIRSEDEPVAIWVPSRNIETWFLYFAGDAGAESDNYKKKGKRPDFKQASEAFVAEFRRWQINPAEVVTLDSLVDAYMELQRIL